MRLRFGTKFTTEYPIAFAAAICLSVIMSRGMLAADGLVGMRHDWPVLPFPGEWWRLAMEAFTGFSQIGLGTPATYPNDWILLLPYGLLSFLISPAAISKFTLLAIPAIAAFSTYVLLRISVRVSPLAAAGGAVFMALSPVLFNKMVAGQLGFLWSYALLPLWLAAYRGIPGNRFAASTIACGVLAGLISNQIQFIVFMGLVMGFDLAIWDERPIRTVIYAAVATVIGIVLAQAGSVVAASLALYQGFAYTVKQPSTFDWIAANSAKFEAALELRGYVAHYFEHAFAGEDFLDQTGIVLGRLLLASLVIGAAVGLRQAAGRFAAALWLFAAIMAAGLHGPAAPFLSWAFAKLPAFQLFRELYHWAALSSLGAAILIGLLIAHAQHAHLAVKIAASVFLLASLAYCHPSYDGVWGYQIQTVKISQPLTEAYNYIARTVREGRVLWLPVDQPVSLSDAWYAGSDPMAYAVPPPPWQYVLDSPISTIAISFRTRHITGLDPLLRYCAVAAIADRREVVSQLPAFLYRRYRSFARTFASDANLRGVEALHWPLEKQNPAVTVWKAPTAPTMITAPIGMALLSPSRDALAAVPPGLSPTFSAQNLGTISTLIYDPEDRDRLTAAFVRVKHNLLDGLLLMNGDAEKGWAQAQGWWSYDELFTRALDFSLLSLQKGSILNLGVIPPDHRVLISFVASSTTGSFQVNIGDISRRISTSSISRSRLRSVSLDAPIGGSITLTNMGGAVALRSVESVPAAEWRESESRLSELERTVPITLLVGGRSNVAIPRDAVWQLHEIRTIDGRRASGPVYLRRGRHWVDANDSFATLSAGGVTALPPLGVPHRMDALGTTLEGKIPATASLFTLRYGYAPGWVLHIEGAEIPAHFQADGFMNGWRFAASTRERVFTVSYSPSSIVTAAHLIACVAMVVAIVVALYLSFLARRAAANASQDRAA